MCISFSFLVFSALHGMPAQMDEKGVRRSVKRVACDKTKEKYV